MKLLRMTTTDTLATFNNNISGDIVLKPNSKVALQNLALEFNPDPITINENNNTIRYSVNDTTTYSAVLDSRLYTHDEIPELLQNITKTMNAQLEVESGSKKVNGVQYLASINNDNIVTIEYKIPEGRTLQEAVQQNIQYDGNLQNVVKRNGGTNGQPDSYLATQVPLGKGAAFFSVRLNALQTSTQQNLQFAIGLVSSTTFQSKSFQFSNFIHGISVKSTVENYGRKGPSYSPSPPTLSPQTGDEIGCYISGGTVELRVYRSGVTDPYVLNSIDYDGTTDLFPVLLFQGSDVTSINNIHITQDPFYLGNTVSHIPSGSLGATIPRQNVTVTNNTLDFSQSVTLARYLGFESVIYGESGAQAAFTADRNTSVLDLADSFVVEMLSMELDSYDTLGQNGKRKSILATIPYNDSEGALHYSVPYLTFIDINNSSPVYLRNIRARVLRNDYSNVEIRGLATMTLIFD